MDKIIGYQIANSRGENIQGNPEDPSGYASFEVLTLACAVDAISEHPGLLLMPIRSGMIEEPSIQANRSNKRTPASPRLSLVDRINSNGIAKGWHSEQFKAKHAREAMPFETMAQFFSRTVASTASAFNVYATAIKAVGRQVTYRFDDGSTASYTSNGSR